MIYKKLVEKEFMEEKINDKENVNDNNKEINFETDLLKYKFDYTTKFKTCDLCPKEKNKFLINLFLISSKLNLFNKLICLNKLYEISKQENNSNMIYNITYKLIRYLKELRVPRQYVNTNILFSLDFLSDLKNYLYAFKSLNDITRITMKKYVDNSFYREIVDFINIKIVTYREIFKNNMTKEKITNLKKKIDNILNSNDNNHDNNITQENNKSINISREIKKDDEKQIKNDDKNKKIEDKIKKPDKVENNENKIVENNNLILENKNENNKNKIIDKNLENKDNRIIKNEANLDQNIVENDKVINLINENENKVNKKEIDLNNEKEKEKPISFDNIKENVENKKLDKQYLYAINKIWLENAKKFIDNCLLSFEGGLIQKFIKDSFNNNYALSVYLTEQKINFIPKNHSYYPFPGPINNFPLTVFKDQWIDPINIEENDLIEKNLINGKDYLFVEYEDWIALQEAFGYTNLIIREKNKIDMLQINAIIFDQRFKKYKNIDINLLKKKVIQINKNAIINDFIQKIFRAVDYEIEQINLNIKNYNKIKATKKIEQNNGPNDKKFNNKEQYNINNIQEDEKPEGETISNDRKIIVYKVNKNNKDIIIEMLICFIHDIVTYESVFVNELNLFEDKKIEEIFKNYNPKKELLIIEIIDSKTSPKFIKQIKPIQENNIYICSICGKKIEDLDDTKYTCELCSMFLFCSKECGKNKDSKNGIEHYKLHNYFSELILNKFDLSEFLSVKFKPEIYKNENNNKNKGIIGLSNLGNTCYMNSSLQCLSNTKDLTKFFLFNYFQNEINLSNKFGSNGVLLKAYYELIYTMWLTDIKKLNPQNFRISFCESTNKFADNQQQDAMEFLSILLNYLHEELNRVTDKPYIPIEEQKSNESDIQASERYWNCHNRRENSIIVDLFHGQFKNIIKCSLCHKDEKNYEPFINISLPIPKVHNFYIIKFFKHLDCKYIAMNIKENTTFGELLEKATNYLSKEILDAWNGIEKDKTRPKYYKRLLERNIELVKLDKNKIINTIYSNPEKEEDIQKNYEIKLLNFFGGGEEIVLFEREIIPNYCQNIYVYPIVTEKQFPDKITLISYPVVFSVKHDLTLGELQKIIFEKFRHILIDSKLNDNNINLIDLNILHSSKYKNTGLFNMKKKYSKCNFCNESFDNKKYCPLFFYFDKKQTVSNILKFSKYSEPIVLLARSFYYDTNKEVYNGFNFKENNLINNYKNIYDSFNIFGTFEYLGENELRKCHYCGKNAPIYKAIRIFKPPYYLILQLKRFKKKNENFFGILMEEKNDSFVSFPTKNLDLTGYIEGPGKINAVYNLYAVINHKSNFGFNHFTAYCRNNDKWIEYDDSKLYSVNNPITNEAYILFYIKKEIDE